MTKIININHFLLCLDYLSVNSNEIFYYKISYFYPVYYIKLIDICLKFLYDLYVNLIRI